MSLKGIRIGELDQLITFQHAVVSTNIFNERKTAWQDYVTEWARIVTMPGRDGYAADQETNFQMVKIYCRFREDITRQMRLVFNGEVYKIVSKNVPAGYRNQLLEIAAELEPETELS